MKHANDQGSAQDKLLEALVVVVAWVSAYLGVVGQWMRKHLMLIQQ